MGKEETKGQRTDETDRQYQNNRLKPNDMNYSIICND